jgi:hypothetical protein
LEESADTGRNPEPMSELTVSRTLVKSLPELWAQCSDPESLARHLQAFGEIKITRLEPETTVTWEGDRASGTVRIEPSGWGTKVTLTANARDAAAADPALDDAAAADPAVDYEARSEPAPRRRGLFAWLTGRIGPGAPSAPDAVAPAVRAPAAVAVPGATPDLDPPAALAGALASLGQAHRRPFSRD